MKVRRISLGVVGLAAAIAVASGCGGATGAKNNTAGGGSGTVVTSNPRTIDPWAQIDNRTNISGTMRVNDSGTTVTEIPINILQTSVATVELSGREETGVDDIYAISSNGRGVYEGDSGSPVLISGDVAGGLFGSADAQHFDARGIEQMESTASGPPVARPLSSRKPARWHIRGPAALMPLIKARPGFGNAVYEGTFTHFAAPIIGGGGVPIIPGLRYASPFVLGDYVVGYDMATYTMETTNGDWAATGHGLEDAGAVSWPVMSVSVIGPNSDGTIHANPTGSIYGTLYYDGEKGSLINTSAPAATMPVTVYLTLNGLPEGTSNNKVRFDQGSGTEDTGIEAAPQSTLQALLQGSRGTFGGTGSIQFVVNGGSVTKTLAFSPGETLSDLVSSAGSQIDAILTAQHQAAPSNQIQSVTVNLGITG